MANLIHALFPIVIVVAQGVRIVGVNEENQG